MPLAPALLSTTTACFVSVVIEAPSARASWSVALPAAKGTTKVIGFSGYLPCAAAGIAMTAERTATTQARRRAMLKKVFMVVREVRWKERGRPGRPDAGAGAPPGRS